jgi:hypothetical protein
LLHAAQFAAALDRKFQARLARELANSSNFGMAKSFCMLGDKLGFDMATQEGLTEFMNFFNSRMLGTPPRYRDESDDWMPSEPAQPRLDGDVPAMLPAPAPRTASERKALNRERQKRLKAIKRRR